VTDVDLSGRNEPITVSGMKRPFACVIASIVAAVLAGCSGDSGRGMPLETTSNSQLQSGGSTDQRRGALTDQPGQAYDSTRTNYRDANAPSRQVPPKPSGGSPDEINGVPDSIRQNVRTPRDEAVARAGLGSTAATLPTPNATKTVPGVGVGNSITLGTVVVEVNGRPIFANKLLQTISPVLAAKAKELDERGFRVAAADEIRKQLQFMINDELVYATAERNLDTNDRRLADAITEHDRDQMIRKAGGSLQLARQAAAAQGQDFDELLADRRRVNLVQVYWRKKEYPKIQVTADDMRQYYRQHLNDRFTERAQAQFRVIKIDFKRTGGREQALAKANDLQARAARGEDFAELAGSINDDPFLMKSKGDVTGSGGWMDRGAYANQKVEQAVWNMRPGDVSPVIESGNAFYIAKLEQKRTGRTQSFDEEAVQSAIRQTLEGEQFNAARERAIAQLSKMAIVTPDPPNLQPVFEMAMQKYREWAAEK